MKSLDTKCDYLRDGLSAIDTLAGRSTPPAAKMRQLGFRCIVRLAVWTTGTLTPRDVSSQDRSNWNRRIAW